jgi:hypothetical protein
MANEVSRRRFMAVASLAGGALALTIPAAAQARGQAGASPTAAYNVEVWLLSTCPK